MYTFTLKTRIFAEGYEQHGKTDPLIPTNNEEQWKDLIARYWGLCSQVDTHAGRILDTLQECGLADNTIVVFTSDHGDMMGSHRLIAKCVMFEEAVRVPMMIRLPGQKKGARIRGPVSQIKNWQKETGNINNTTKRIISIWLPQFNTKTSFPE
ncbi:MAG: sulfatase-like hydrolase/transferase [Planctomycetota bacterium]